MKQRCCPSTAGHLTDRDRELVRLVARHRVLTTDQLAALAFRNITTARHRLAVLVRLGLLRRFRPHRATGSAPWHYVLGPIGAALLGQENRDEKRWLPQVRADRQLALERSQRLGHMTGASWFFVALARHAREHGGGELLQWDSEGQASDYLYAHSRELGPRPDGLGVWAQDGRDITFLLEYDTGTEHLPQLTAKLCGYAESARTNLALTMPLLFCFLTPRREQTARKALATTRASLDLHIATAALDPRATCPACAAAWMPLHGGHPPMRLIDLGNVLPDPWRTEREYDELDPAETGLRWSRTAYDQPRHPQLTDRRFPQHPAPLERTSPAGPPTPQAPSEADPPGKKAEDLCPDQDPGRVSREQGLRAWAAALASELPPLTSSQAAAVARIAARLDARNGQKPAA